MLTLENVSVSYGAIEALTFGRLESPALWLHDGIRELLGDLGDQSDSR